MICSSCRYAGNIRALAAQDGNGEEISDEKIAELHARCTEADRRSRGLTAVELKGSAWCDCQHVVPVRRAVVRPTLE